MIQSDFWCNMAMLSIAGRVSLTRIVCAQI